LDAGLLVYRYLFKNNIEKMVYVVFRAPRGTNVFLGQAAEPATVDVTFSLEELIFWLFPSL
jgi:hypothetical protein